MRIYMFKSQAQSGLRAFADDEEGTKLPEKFAPWDVTGVIAAERNPPFNLSRKRIEGAIKAEGFQLWRMKADNSNAKAADPS